MAKKVQRIAPKQQRPKGRGASHPAEIKLDDLRGRTGVEKASQLAVRVKRTAKQDAQSLREMAQLDQSELPEQFVPLFRYPNACIEIVGTHIDGLGESGTDIITARSAVQRLVKIAMPEWRVRLERGVPQDLLAGLVPLLDQFDTAAHELMDALDGKTLVDVVEDSAIRYGPWSPPMRQMLKLQGRLISGLMARRAAPQKGGGGAADEFRPAGYFGKKLADRLRMAAQKSRKTKRVRTRVEDGVVLYSVADASKWWQSDMPKDA